jgi:hypothetical protein
MLLATLLPLLFLCLLSLVCGRYFCLFAPRPPCLRLLLHSSREAHPVTLLLRTGERECVFSLSSIPPHTHAGVFLFTESVSPSLLSGAGTSTLRHSAVPHLLLLFLLFLLLLGHPSSRKRETEGNTPSFGSNVFPPPQPPPPRTHTKCHSYIVELTRRHHHRRQRMATPLHAPSFTTQVQ